MKSYIYVMREQLRVTDLRQIDEDRARAIDNRHTRNKTHMDAAFYLY